MTTVHIACSAKNAAQYLDAFLDSLEQQTHTDWALWIRDDGSTDATWALIEARRAREPRIVWATRGEKSLGLVQAFADVLRQIPADAAAIATADADDVWMPRRIEATLAALEKSSLNRPTMVCSDLTVVDAKLQTIASSYWDSEGIDPDAATLSTLTIQNVAVGPTLLFNAALLAELRTFPPEALNHDWWIALCAVVTGTIVPVREATVLYRQHSANNAAAVGQRWRRALNAFAVRARVRRQLDLTGLQTGAVLRQFGDRIAVADKTALEGQASIATLRGMPRKVAIARWRWFAPHGILRNVGILLRG